MGHPLDDVEVAVEAGRIGEALEAMLGVWRAKRAPAYAEAVDALSSVAAKAAGPLVGVDHVEWMERASARRAEDVGVLIDALLQPPVGTLGGRVEQLVARPDDPRIAMAFAKVALEPPATSSANFPLWTKLLASLSAAGDTRVVPVLEARLKRRPGTTQFWTKLYTGLRKVLDRMPAPPPLTRDESRRATAIAKAAAAATPTFVAPSDDGSLSIDGAVKAAREGDLEACLDVLLAVWRANRIAALGAMIDRVGAMIDDGFAPPGGKELKGDWAALAAKRRPADVGRLAAAAADGLAGEAEPRLDEMLGWPEDPRIGRAMLIAAIRVEFADRARAWRLVADLIRRNCDPRFRPTIATFIDLASEPAARCRARHLRRVAPGTLEALDAVPATPAPEDAAALDSLGRVLDARMTSDIPTERRFLEEILAAPAGDNGPRLVYADWLMERGHPRGELIILQCRERTPEAAARIAQIQREHARALLGPAAAVVYSHLEFALQYGKTVFDRGLLQKVEVCFPVPSWLFEDSPLLWFIEEIQPKPEVNDVVAALLRASRRVVRVAPEK